MFSKSVTSRPDTRRKSVRNFKKSRRTFSKTADHTRKENYNGNPMRGGIRL